MPPETPQQVESCSCCMYYRAHSDGFGDCRRYPPTFVGGEALTEKHRWRHPLVPQHNWCGEFSPR